MTTKLETMELTLTRTIPASPAEVFRAWMDPTHPGNPWTGARKLIFDGRVDGLFYFLHVATSKDAQGRDAAVLAQAGDSWAHYGRFMVVEPHERLQYAWMSPFTLGLESIVTVTFAKQGDDTLVTLNHANLPDDERGRLHEGGWNKCLDAFGERFRVTRSSEAR